MNRLLPLLALGGAACALGILFTIISLQRSAIHRLEQAGRDKDRFIGEVTAANAGLTAALDQMADSARRTDELLTEHADKNDELHRKTRSLEKRLREAIRHETIVALDDPLPPDAAYALCLRWRAAAGLANPPAGNTPALPDAGTNNTPARNTAPPPTTPGTTQNPCAGWEKITLRDILEWSGSLLDHAGAERLDKAALREWVRE